MVLKTAGGEVLGKPDCTFSMLKWSFKKDRDRLWKSVCNYRTSGHAFHLNGQIQDRYDEEMFHCENGETVVQVAHNGGGCPSPGNLQGYFG